MYSLYMTKDSVEVNCLLDTDLVTGSKFIRFFGFLSIFNLSHGFLHSSSNMKPFCASFVVKLFHLPNVSLIPNSSALSLSFVEVSLISPFFVKCKVISGK
eukprot:NODE_273_length_12179_cov_0.492632.p9 type:complete len:100 gc:universal NODE_273_length_12179_cov_0.492632:1098-1397(+)